MKKSEIMSQIASNRKTAADVKVREARDWKYKIPYTMVILNCAEDNSSRIIITVGIEISTGTFVEKEFGFSTQDVKRYYLDRFLYKITNGEGDEISNQDIIGIWFTGSIERNGDFDNLTVWEIIDNTETDTDDDSADEDSTDEYIDVDEDDLPF